MTVGFCASYRKPAANRSRCRPRANTEADGGPGIRQISELLHGNDDLPQDRRQFLKALAAFWLLGATDGHSKNFSLRLHPQGGRGLAPLYDVISTQPAYDAKQIRRNQIKFAMAVGDNRHYRIDRIRPRQFAQTAMRNGISEQDVHQVFQELLDGAEPAIERAVNALPADSPEALLSSIVSGMTARLNFLEDGFSLAQRREAPSWCRQRQATGNSRAIIVNRQWHNRVPQKGVGAPRAVLGESAHGAAGTTGSRFHGFHGPLAAQAGTLDFA